MTRRQLLDRVALCTAGSLSCIAKRAPLEEQIKQWEERNGLAIINISLTALNVSGTRVGRLELPNCCTAEPSVSPDAERVAWIPSSPSLRPSGPEDSVVRITDGINSVRTVRYAGHLAREVTISSKATRVVLVAMIDLGDGYRLISLEGDKQQQDLTPLLTRFGPAEIERLRLCGRGQYLAVGSRSSLILIELNAGRVVFESSGRFAALSPDGNNLAFIDEHEQLICRTIAHGTSKFLRREWKTCGVGGWSPDSRYLLAGRRDSLSLWNRLSVVDTVEDEAVDSFKLGEGDYGDRCVWVSRRLISA